VTEFVRSSVDGSVATLTIDRADRHNSLVTPLLEELTTAVETATDDEHVRVIRLETVGSSFSTGGDVAAINECRDDHTALAECADRLVGELNASLLALSRSPVPVVVGVDGVVTGGSIGFLAVADAVVMDPAATITPYYPVVGFSPDGGWTALVPDIIGPTRTRRVLTTNQTVTAQQAHAWGLVTDVTPDVAAETKRLAKTIADGRPGSLTATRSLVGPRAGDLETRLATERRTFVEQVVTEEALDGMAAFLE